MVFIKILLSVSWISFVAIIWLYTDTVLYYSHLFGVFENIRLKATAFIKKNPDKYFPDYLYSQSLQTKNRKIKFLLKLASCPFCFLVWLSVIAGFIIHNVASIALIYILSLFIVLEVKKRI